MRIRYRVTKDVRDVDASVARTLIDRHLADPVDEVAPAAKPAKRKGRYQRRDMRAAG